METSDKFDDKSLPLMTPKTAGGSQRVIKQIMVIDPNKLRLAGLDVKMAEALKKAKKKKSEPKSKETKLAAAKSILNKKLKEALAKKDLLANAPSSPETSIKSVKPSDEAVEKPTPTEKNKVSAKTKHMINVASLKSLMPPPSFPVSSLISANQKVEVKFLKSENTKQTIEVKILDAPVVSPKKIDIFPKASLKTPPVIKNIKTKTVTPEIKFEVSQKLSIPGEATGFEVSTNKILRTPQPEIVHVGSNKKSQNSRKEITGSIQNKSLINDLEHLTSFESKNSQIANLVSPVIDDKSFSQMTRSLENPSGESFVTESKTLNETPNVSLPSSPSPLKPITSTPKRREFLPKVIESKVLSPGEKIDLSILTNKSPATLTVPKKRYKLEQNWISSKSSTEEPVYINLSPAQKSSPPPESVAQESAVDFINNLSLFLAESTKNKSQSRDASDILTKECGEDATSFLVSLFQNKQDTSLKDQTTPPVKENEDCKTASLKAPSRTKDVEMKKDVSRQDTSSNPSSNNTNNQATGQVRKISPKKEIKTKRDSQSDKKVLSTTLCLLDSKTNPTNDRITSEMKEDYKPAISNLEMKNKSEETTDFQKATKPTEPKKSDDDFVKMVLDPVVETVKEDITLPSFVDLKTSVQDDKSDNLPKCEDTCNELAKDHSQNISTSIVSSEEGNRLLSDGSLDLNLQIREDKLITSSSRKDDQLEDSSRDVSEENNKNISTSIVYAAEGDKTLPGLSVELKPSKEDNAAINSNLHESKKSVESKPTVDSNKDSVLSSILPSVVEDTKIQEAESKTSIATEPETEQVTVPKTSTPPVSTRRKTSRPIPVLIPKLRKSRKPPTTTQKPAEEKIPPKSLENREEQSPTQPVQPKESSNDPPPSDPTLCEIEGVKKDLPDNSTIPVAQTTRRTRRDTTKSNEESPSKTSKVVDELPITNKTERPQRQRKASLKLKESSECLSPVKPSVQGIKDQTDEETKNETKKESTTMTMERPQRQRKVSFKLLDASETYPPATKQTNKNDIDEKAKIELTSSTERPQRQRKISLRLLESSESLPAMKSLIQVRIRSDEKEIKEDKTTEKPLSIEKGTENLIATNVGNEISKDAIEKHEMPCVSENSTKFGTKTSTAKLETELTSLSEYPFSDAVYGELSKELTQENQTIKGKENVSIKQYSNRNSKKRKDSLKSRTFDGEEMSIVSNDALIASDESSINLQNVPLVRQTRNRKGTPIIPKCESVEVAKHHDTNLVQNQDECPLNSQEITCSLEVVDNLNVSSTDIVTPNTIGGKKRKGKLSKSNKEDQKPDTAEEVPDVSHITTESNSTQEVSNLVCTGESCKTLPAIDEPLNQETKTTPMTRLRSANKSLSKEGETSDVKIRRSNLRSSKSKSRGEENLVNKGDSKGLSEKTIDLEEKMQNYEKEVNQGVTKKEEEESYTKDIISSEIFSLETINAPEKADAIQEQEQSRPNQKEPDIPESTEVVTEPKNFSENCEAPQPSTVFIETSKTAASQVNISTEKICADSIEPSDISSAVPDSEKEPPSLSDGGAKIVELQQSTEEQINHKDVIFADAESNQILATEVSKLEATAEISKIPSVKTDISCSDSQYPKTSSKQQSKSLVNELDKEEEGGEIKVNVDVAKSRICESQPNTNPDPFDALKPSKPSSVVNESKENIPSKITPHFEDLLFDLDHIESPSFSPICESSRISNDSDGFEVLDEDLTSAIIDTVTEAETLEISLNATVVPEETQKDISFTHNSKSSYFVDSKPDNVKQIPLEPGNDSKLMELSENSERDSKLENAVSKRDKTEPDSSMPSNELCKNTLKDLKPLKDHSAPSEKAKPESSELNSDCSKNTSALFEAPLSNTEQNKTKSKSTRKSARNPFKTQIHDEKELEKRSQSEFLGFNEKEIEEGQQSTSLRLSQSEDIEVANTELPLKRKTNKKQKIKESQHTSGIKQTRKQMWEKNSAESLKNWLSKPVKVSAADKTCDKQEEKDEQSSSVPPKKRRSKVQNLKDVDHLKKDLNDTDNEINTVVKVNDSVLEESCILSETKERPKRGKNPKQKDVPKVEESQDTTNPKEDTNSPSTKNPKEDSNSPPAKRKYKKRQTPKVNCDDEKLITTRRGRKSKVVDQSIEMFIKKEPSENLISPTKGRGRKRKQSASEEAESTITEPPAKVAHIDEEIICPDDVKPVRKRGRPKKNPEDCSPKEIDTSKRKSYKSDVEFNPRLLLIRTKEELKSDEPLVDPNLQTERQNPDDIQCALCLGYAPKKKWIQHLANHYGVGWVVGQPPPLNIKSRGSVLNYIIEFYKAYKVKGLTCRLCNTLRRSGLGLLMHIEQCCLTEEEINENRVVCEYCQKNYSKSSYVIHRRTCSEYLKLILEQSKAENPPEEAKDVTADDVLSNTGRLKRKAVIKAETMLKNLDEAHEFIPDELIKHIPLTSIASMESAKKNWLKEINLLGKCFCASKKCPFTSTLIDDLVEHYQENVCPYFEKPGFFCLKCKFHNDDMEIVRSHVTKMHTPRQKRDKGDSDAEIDGSESSDSVSSGDDEAESGSGSAEEDGEENGDGERKPKRTKKSKKKTKRKRFQNKHPPTKEYRKLLPERCTNIHNIVTKWYDKFIEENYSFEPLFTFAKPHYSRIEASDSYYPKMTNSLKFTHDGFNGYVKTLGESKVEPDKWKQLKRLEGCSENSEYNIFMGGPVKNIVWLPLDPHPPSNTQYLAVTVRKGLEKFTRFSNQKRSRSLIFILKFDISLPSEIKAEILYAIAIEEGPIHAIEFLPSGGYSPAMNRLGMLAVGTIETEIKIYSLPLVVEKFDCDLFPIIKLEASMELHLQLLENQNDTEDIYGSQCTCLVWSQTAGHNIIAGGFLNGFVGFWDISDDSDNLNRVVLNETIIFTPVSYFWTFDDRLLHMALHYDINGPRWLAVSNAARKLLVYDLRDITEPLLLCVEVTINIINSLHWPIIWENLMFGLGDAMPSNGCVLTAFSPMAIVYANRRFDKFCTGATDMHYNVWKNGFVGGADNGDIQVTRLREGVLDVSQRLKMDDKTISTLDIVSLKGEDISSPNGIKLPSDGMRVFDRDYTEQYGLVFGSIRKIKGSKKPEYYNNKRVPPLNLQRLMRVSKVRFNHHKNACDFLAIGYDNGLLRVRMHDWIKYD